MQPHDPLANRNQFALRLKVFDVEGFGVTRARLDVSDEFFCGLNGCVGHDGTHVESALNLDDKTSDRPRCPLSLIERMVELSTVKLFGVVLEVHEQRIEIGIQNGLLGLRSPQGIRRLSQKVRQLGFSYYSTVISFPSEVPSKLIFTVAEGLTSSTASLYQPI
jgi:hypothetical protein